MDTLFELVTGRFRRLARARLRVALLQLSAGAFGVIALTALLAAGAILLSRWIGPFGAALASALAAALAALVLFLAAAAQRRAADRRDATEAAAQRQALLLLLAGLPALRARGTLLAAVALGLLAALAAAADRSPDDHPPKDNPPAG